MMRAIDDAEGLDLAFAERAGVAVEAELVGDRAQQVVEGLQGGGVAVGGQVAGPGVVAGCGVGQLDVG